MATGVCIRWIVPAICPCRGLSSAFVSEQRQGLIAILDALGAATYTDTEIDNFLKSRDLVLNKLQEGAEKSGIDTSRLRVFTFNDTVVIVYLAGESADVTLKDIQAFGIRLRALMMHSFQSQILFRGSLSVGSFRSVEDKTNTVLGAAVTDAAAWYDKADWIGIAATPHASIVIRSLLERHATNLDFILLDYDVPMKAGIRPVKVKAVNWPKAFYVKGLRPEGDDSGRSMLLAFLAQHRVPLGTESKYDNAMAFFDAVQKSQGLGKETEVKDPNPKTRRSA